VATKHNNGANLSFENQMWAAADKLRGHMDASEYKYVVMGLIFLKYISDSFRPNIANTLASLHDTVLPRLISGELRLPDADKFVEESGV